MTPPSPGLNEAVQAVDAVKLRNLNGSWAVLFWALIDALGVGGVGGRRVYGRAGEIQAEAGTISEFAVALLAGEAHGGWTGRSPFEVRP
jgi:hypothetical protein